MREGRYEMSEKTVNIAIDGPAGAGKSTVAKRIAMLLGYIYVDTGAMYRAMAVYFLRKGIAADDAGAVAEACRDADVSLSFENGVQHVLLNGEDVTDCIRTEEVGKMASSSSTVAEVRKKLVESQQKLAAEKSVVMDGRDIGTVVLPHADVKIFLTASPHIRAVRRYEELKEKGIPGNLSDIEKDIEERDYRDSHRENSPMIQAEDSILVDSSDLSLEEVTSKCMEIIHGKS